MKRLLALLLAFVMTIPMVACSKTDSNSSTDSSPEIGVAAPSEDVAMQYITVDDAHAVLEDDAYIFFDVRMDADYKVAHIPGAEGHDMDAAKNGDFAAGVATMNPAIKDLDKNIILVCYSGKRYAQAATNVLSALGYDMSKVYTLEGGFTAWTEKFADVVEVSAEIVAPAEDVAMQYMTPAEAAEKMGNEEYVFLDVRKNADFQVATIPGAKGYDMDAAKEGNFEAGVATMQVATRDRSKNLIIICYSGKRYAQATTNVLSALGYDMSKVYTLEGGFTAWSAAYPDKLQVGIVAPAEDVAMQYMTPADAAELLGNEEYVFFDVRKAADSLAATIPGAKAYDMDAAKEGNFDAGVATMQIATRNLDKNIVIICYSGKRYAQATTNVLSALGYDMSKVYTLEGGFTAWSAAHPDKIEVGIVAPAENVAMQYISVAETETVLENEEYVIFDVRKAADYQTATIPGALGYDMDAAKEGNFAAGVATMQTAIRNLDKKIILVCYSGKRYAQAATNVLYALGYDMSKVYTLEGGFTAWSEAHP